MAQHQPRLRKAFTIVAVSAALGLLVTALIAGTPGKPGDTTADKVLGQYDFAHSAPDQPHQISNLVDGKGIDLSFANTAWVAIDSSASTHHLYISDYHNSRVLGWRSADGFSNGTPADLVIGQPDFISYLPNNGGESASSLNQPTGLAVDGSGNLYVADDVNGRVLEYDNPFAACGGVFPCVGGPAHLVFGTCGSFTGGSCSISPSADSLRGYGVSGVWIAASGNLFVADSLNNRVLEYFAPFTGGTHSGTPGFPGDTTADVVFGQSGSFSATGCEGLPTTADTLCRPVGVSLDSAGNALIADANNHRVLKYLAPFTGGTHTGTPGFAGDTTADLVFGQNGLFTTADYLPLSASTLKNPVSVVTNASGDVYIADSGNNRVLEFDAPVGAIPSASMVFGQDGSFTTANCFDDDSSPYERPRPSADTLCNPEGMAVDRSNGNLFVIDGGGNRMLEYDNPVATGGGTPGKPGSAGDTTADAVLGQANFNHTIANFVDGRGL